MAEVVAVGAGGQGVRGGEPGVVPLQITCGKGRECCPGWGGVCWAGAAGKLKGTSARYAHPDALHVVDHRHEGLAEVVAVGDDVQGVRVGDRVVVPFQISCGTCRECRRGVTGSCGSVPLMSTYGMAPISGRDGGGFMADLVLVPYADAMLIPIPETVDPVAVASLSDNIPDGWRTVGPFKEGLAKLDPDERRVLVVGRLSIGLYAAAFAAALGAHVDYVDTDGQRLAAAEKLGAMVHDRAKPDKSWERYPITR